jgi:transposase
MPAPRPPTKNCGRPGRHRLSRAGNRQSNRVIHTVPVVQLRHPTTEGRAYYDRRTTDGKTSMETMRALNAGLSNLIYKTLLDDALKCPASTDDQMSPLKRSNTFAWSR